ncbi:MAG: DUF2752 domain-containing protein [Ruminococcaceae bacterium]|nr:DUF2752 domain-containing protein [Oscillospiraceae bacterium]
MKKRAIKVSIFTFLILAFGLLYALLFAKTGYGIPCLTRKFTGLLCPTCGTTRMCANLLKADFAEAWKSNPFIMCLLPYFIFLLTRYIYHYIKSGKTPKSLPISISLYVCLFLFLAVFFLRNFTNFSF